MGAVSGVCGRCGATWGGRGVERCPAGGYGAKEVQGTGRAQGQLAWGKVRQRQPAALRGGHGALGKWEGGSREKGDVKEVPAPPRQLVRASIPPLIVGGLLLVATNPNDSDRSALSQ